MSYQMKRSRPEKMARTTVQLAFIKSLQKPSPSPSTSETVKQIQAATIKQVNKD
jgi:hypothetical protein